MQACKPTFPLQIIIDAPSLQREDAQHLVRTTQHTLDDLNEFSAHHLRLRLARSSTESDDSSIREINSQREEEEVALTVNVNPVEGLSTTVVNLESHSMLLDVSYAAGQVSSTSSTSSALANIIANTLQEMFAEEQASIAYILSGSQTSGNGPHSSTGNGQTLQISQSITATRDSRNGVSRIISPELATKLARRSTRAVKYAPLYHITISLFTSSGSPSSWDIASAIDEYFAPLLESFSVSNFTVDTQVQLYAKFSPSVQPPKYDTAMGAWTLRAEDLSGFINAAEWPLGPSIGAGPTLNFIMYVPDKSISPLLVENSYANSWLIPQWGGVTILNLPDTISESSPALLALDKESIRPALLTFSHQLLSLLGAPESPPSFPLQLQTLTRVRAASLLLSASSTMGSLARLTVALPSIAIPETVAVAVDRTLSHLRDTCTYLRDGKFHAALEHARIAEAEAEKGFFEKSMVGMVYFPDEHKLAVYLPLLGPIGVPLLMSAAKEIRRLWIVIKSRQSSD